MRAIVKNPEPESLSKWNKDHAGTTYSDLRLPSNRLEGQIVINDIRRSCLEEQFYLCGYCCDRISFSTSHNEHIIPQGKDVSLSLVYDNIIASCEAKTHCGHYKEANLLSLTPLMNECETEVQYNLNGKMRHTTQRAYNLNLTVNLYDRKLVIKRKKFIELAIFEFGSSIEEISILEDEFIELFIEELATPDKDNKLEAFAPVLISILKEFIS